MNEEDGGAQVTLRSDSAPLPGVESSPELEFFQRLRGTWPTQDLSVL